jgi:hypothetical protein
MEKDTQIPQRKDEHIHINLEKDVASASDDRAGRLPLCSPGAARAVPGRGRSAPGAVRRRAARTGTGLVDDWRHERMQNASTVIWRKRQRRSGWRWVSDPSGRQSRMRAWRRASRYGVTRPRSCCLPTWARYSSTMVTGSTNAGVRSR